MTPKTIRALEKLHKFFQEDPERWVPAFIASDADGNGVTEHDPFAIQWSLLGAAGKVARDDGYLYEDMEAALFITFRAKNLGVNDYDLEDWEDAPERTPQHVMDLIQDTIERLQRALPYKDQVQQVLANMDDIFDAYRWSEVHPATDREGNPVSPALTSAVAFSITGALGRAIIPVKKSDPVDLYRVVQDALEETVVTYADYDTLAAWATRPYRKPQDVQNLLRKTNKRLNHGNT